MSTRWEMVAGIDANVCVMTGDYRFRINGEFEGALLDGIRVPVKEMATLSHRGKALRLIGYDVH